MAVFEPVRLTWKGTEYVIPPDQVMRCIAKIEDVITLAELHRAMGKPPLAKLAMAYGAALRHAGARAEDDEVYAAMFKSGKDMHGQVTGAVYTLLVMMMPPDALKLKGA